MTPQELHTALDTARRERGLRWWQVAAELDVSLSRITRLRQGLPSPAVTDRAPAWLERRQAPPRQKE